MISHFMLLLKSIIQKKMFFFNTKRDFMYKLPPLSSKYEVNYDDNETNSKKLGVGVYIVFLKL